MTVVRRGDPNIEGRIWPRIDPEDGGRYVGIPLARSVRGFTTVQGTGCGTPVPGTPVDGTHLKKWQPGWNDRGPR